MEDDAVIEAAPRQLLDARHRLGREIGPHLDDDPSGGNVEIEGVLEIGRLGGSAGDNEEGGEGEQA